MNRFQKALCLLLTAGSATTLQAQNINTAKLDSFFNALEANNKMMGSVAVAKNGKLLYTRAIGYAQVAAGAGIRADADTKYRIGSITKMFTTVMVFQLAEEKKLSLDAKLSQWYPQVPNADKITIAQMLNHHSGIYNFTDDSTYTNWMEQPKTQDEMLKIIAAHTPAFAPGEKAEYSNANFVLLGYIIEKVTKSTYAEQLKKRVLQKAGLKNTAVGGKINTQNHEAMSYEFEHDQWQPATETDMSIPAGAGCIISTPSDLTKFITALYNGKLISKASLQQMTTIKDGYGMGIFEMPWYQRKSYGHTGGIDGFSSMLGYFPDDSISFAGIVNGGNYSTNDVGIGTLSIIYNMPFEIPNFKTISLSPKQLSYYQGVYASKQIPLKITVTQRDNRLLAQATGQSVFPLDAVSETEFKFDAAGILMIFKRDDDGNIRQFTLKQGGGNYLFEKESQ
jgi:CubicO group peptidase (beta-lactamase class C family)